MRVRNLSCSSAPAVGTCRFAPLMIAAMVLIVCATGCIGRQDPTSYGDSVKEHFVEGCMAGYVPEEDQKDPAAKVHRELCTCLYTQLSDEQTGIPFEKFSDAQSRIREDPTDPANSIDKLIPKFSEYAQTCKHKTIPGP